MSATSIDDCKIIDLPKIKDPKGSLTFIESEKHIPFKIKRIFYIYDVPTGENRGSHAHYTLKEFIVCVSGSFDVNLDDGKQKKVIHLNRPWRGVLIPPMTWLSYGNFDAGSVCLVAASDFYKADDYIRDYDEFLKTVQLKK